MAWVEVRQIFMGTARTRQSRRSRGAFVKLYQPRPSSPPRRRSSWRRNLFHHFDIITQTSHLHVKPITTRRQRFKRRTFNARPVSCTDNSVLLPDTLFNCSFIWLDVWQTCLLEVEVYMQQGNSRSTTTTAI